MCFLNCFNFIASVCKETVSISEKLRTVSAEDFWFFKEGLSIVSIFFLFSNHLGEEMNYD